MRLKSLLPACAAILALALVAGCGGGGGSDSTVDEQPTVEEEPKLSKAAYIRQGDDICAEVNTAIGAAGEAETETVSPTTQIASLYVGLVESLQGLGQPAETDGYADFTGAAEELAKVEGEVKSAAERNNLALEEEASQLAAPAVEEFHSQAAVYGFEECSEEPQAPVATSESGGIEPEEGVEEGGLEAAPEEEIVPEEEVAPEEEIVPEEQIEEVAPEEEIPAPDAEEGGVIEEEEFVPEEGGESGGIGAE